jgi:hypothetical protein
MTLGGDDPEWIGCHVGVVEEDGQAAITLVPQVRFPTKVGGWVFVAVSDPADTSRPLPEDIDRSGDIRLISRSAEMEE